MPTKATLYERTQNAYSLKGVTCERCGNKPAVERHHKDHDLANIARDNIELLCRDCHRGHAKPGVGEANRKRVWTPVMRSRLSLAKLGNQHLKGHRHSDATKAKMRAAHAKRREIEAAELR